MHKFQDIFLPPKTRYLVSVTGHLLRFISIHVKWVKIFCKENGNWLVTTKDDNCRRQENAQLISTFNSLALCFPLFRQFYEESLACTVENKWFAWIIRHNLYALCNLCDVHTLNIFKPKVGLVIKQAKVLFCSFILRNRSM